MNCPNCSIAIPDAVINRFVAARAGKGKSEAKAKAARLNGLRPKLRRKGKWIVIEGERRYIAPLAP